MDTASNADRRIMKSRQTLMAYKQGLASLENMMLLREEITILESLAFAHPAKAEKIARLIGEWKDYMALVDRKVH